MLGANDIEESKAFYDATLSVLGARPGKLSLNHDCLLYTSPSPRD